MAWREDVEDTVGHPAVAVLVVAARVEAVLEAGKAEASHPRVDTRVDTKLVRRCC